MPAVCRPYQPVKPRMPQNGFLGADHSPTTPLLPKGDLPAVAVPRIARESISQPGTPTERDRVLNEHRQLHPQSSFQYSISRRPGKGKGLGGRMLSMLQQKPLRFFGWLATCGHTLGLVGL
ncbi:hypothetical protein WJX84_001845 [Apatococcus fuscideae]|uniref:Uncharacterized protein n=1 Tax=Apatococcus fuscideae TaxID=2026836 RepID=A0AAW1STD7_9CHLO